MGYQVKEVNAQVRPGLRRHLAATSNSLAVSVHSGSSLYVQYLLRHPYRNREEWPVVVPLRALPLVALALALAHAAR